MEHTTLATTIFIALLILIIWSTWILEYIPRFAKRKGDIRTLARLTTMAMCGGVFVMSDGNHHWWMMVICAIFVLIAIVNAASDVFKDE